ncbi:peptidoglycan-binding protein [Shimia sp.]|uniref:peptidoglycan-binding protein n=1 Tax=Shimia sp. TaxID=1954381 RepID=UPI003563D3B0
MPKPPPFKICFALLLCGLLAAACLGPAAPLAPAVAEPDTGPARNFTSFAPALRCMDRLLATSRRPPLLISSNGFPDRTEDLDLGADDMLINAINQLNAGSRKYQFLDQALQKDFGQLDLLTVRKEDELSPQIYIRGAISQIDERAADAGVTGDFDGASGAPLVGAYLKGSRSLSVITVDMHLVEYPSRRVIPGGSVANSMVVMQRRLDGTLTGLISRGTLGIPLYVERIESRGQAVRNLIEVGVIELLGRHAGVPYWSCLDSPAGEARASEARERDLLATPDSARIARAQGMLVALGRLRGHAPGQLDTATRRALSRFQSDQRLLPNGRVDFDTYEALTRQSAAGMRPAPVSDAPAPALHPTVPPPPAPAAAPAATPAAPRAPECNGDRNGEPGCDGDFLNLYDFLRRL